MIGDLSITVTVIGFLVGAWKGREDGGFEGIIGCGIAGVSIAWMGFYALVFVTMLGRAVLA